MHFFSFFDILYLLQHFSKFSGILSFKNIFKICKDTDINLYFFPTHTHVFRYVLKENLLKIFKIVFQVLNIQD